MLTATCHNCGAAKDPAHYAANHCVTCEATKAEAEQHFAAENPEANRSEVLYAGRQALMQRAHHSNRDFVDPRGFSAAHGMIPVPPQTNRGSTNS